MLLIDLDARVAEVLHRYPATYAVFQRYGCPDMRSGFFHMMARVMSVRNAARLHRIPLDELRDSLQQVINEEELAHE